jgi:uncharacterized protein YdaU (DUF1376 family)
MSSAAPAIPLFGDAYIADTRHLSLEEHGAYLNLMMIAWRAEDCSLPDDDARLARMLGVTAKKWANLKPTVMDFWTLSNGRWSQKRLTKERRFVAKKSEQNAEAANARWKAKPLKTNEAHHANASPAQSERNAPPPSPPQVREDTPIGVVRASATPEPRKHRLPDDWKPLAFTPGTDAAQIVERWQPGRLERELAKFRAHYAAAGTKWKCWQLVWCKWVNNSDDFQRGSQHGGNHQHLGKSGQAFAMQGNLSDDRPF